MLWHKDNINTISGQAYPNSIRLNNCHFYDGLANCIDPVMFVSSLSDYMRQIKDYQFLDPLKDFRGNTISLSDEPVTWAGGTVRNQCSYFTNMALSTRFKLYGKYYNRKR